MKIKVSVAILWLMAALLFAEIGIEYEDTTLSKIKGSPTSFKNLGVKVKIIFNSLTDNWVPVYTFFSPEKYINFAGWGYEEHIWYKKVLLNDYPYFYIRKDIDEARKIVKANKYQCFELKGVVRNVYEGKAWIEVESIKPSTSPCIDEDILSLAIKANESFRKDDFIETLYFADKLKNKSLPSDLDIRIRDIKCFSYLQLNLKKDALHCYRSLFSITGEEKYKMIIERLKKYSSQSKLNKNMIRSIKKLQHLLIQKDRQIESLQKEIVVLKKNILNKNLKTQSANINNQTNFSRDISFIKLTLECNNLISSGRRTVEKRLDRDEMSEMIEKRRICSNLHKESNKVVWANIPDIQKPLDEKIEIENKKEKNTNISNFFRRIIDRRLDREEFEYLLNKNRKPL